MRSLFSLDNPVMHFLSEVGDMIIANLAHLFPKGHAAQQILRPFLWAQGGILIRVHIFSSQ